VRRTAGTDPYYAYDETYDYDYAYVYEDEVGRKRAWCSDYQCWLTTSLCVHWVWVPHQVDGERADPLDYPDNYFQDEDNVFLGDRSSGGEAGDASIAASG
jgi:hypothetical protein